MSNQTATRTSNAKRNVKSAMINKFAIMALTFICRKVFIQYIGVELLGVNSLFSNILTLLAMADLGLGTAMNINFYKPIAEDNFEKISQLMNYYKTLYRYIMLGVAGIGLAILPFLGYLVDTDIDMFHLGMYYLFYLGNSVASYMVIYKSSIIYAHQKKYLINKIDLFVTILKVILQIITIVIFKNYIVYLALNIIGTLAHNIYVSRLADQQYPYINDGGDLPKEEKKNILSDMYSIFVYKMSVCILGGADNIIISVVIGTIFVGYYSNYYLITNSSEAIISLLFSTLTPIVGSLVVKTSKENQYSVFQSLQLVSSCVNMIVCVNMYFLIDDFIMLWLGQEFVMEPLVKIALIINMFYAVTLRPVLTFREGVGMYRHIRYIMLAAAILNIIFSVILGYLLGVAGVVMSTALSKLLTSFWFEPNKLIKTFFDKSPKSFYLEALGNAVIIVIAIIPLTYLYALIPQVSILNWILKGMITTAVMGTVCLLRFRKRPAFKSLISRLKYKG